MGLTSGRCARRAGTMSRVSAARALRLQQVRPGGHDVGSVRAPESIVTTKRGRRRAADLWRSRER